MSTNISNQGQSYEKPSKGAIIGGVIAGGVTKNAIIASQNIIAVPAMRKMNDISRSLSADEFKKVEEAAAKVIKDTGLGEKGVGIVKATNENAAEISKIMNREINNSIYKFLPEKIRNLISNFYSSQMATGANACYTFASKKIIMPEKELSLAFFHEAGHAMNANLSKFGKALQKCRSLGFLAIPISMIALFKTKKAEGEQPKNGWDKATTFIKNNAGKLTFAAFMPMVLEEGLASIKGNKLAKKLLSPELAKKVAKSNALGFVTYAALASLAGLGVYLGTKVKDAIASNKSVKQKAANAA